MKRLQLNHISCRRLPAAGKYGQKLLDWIFPKRCPVCDGLLSPAEGLCHRECFSELTFVGDRGCMRCGKLMTGEGALCRDCRAFQARGRKDESFDLARALLLYQGKTKLTMYRFKYSNRREYARFFAEELAKRYGNWLREEQVSCIMAVPMHRAKQRKRGYNQARSLAHALSEQTGIPVEEKALIRRKKTRALKLMDDSHRRQELRSAFGVTAAYDPGREPVVLVVDDIFTTGATAEGIAGVLKAAGAARVLVLCVCTARANEKGSFDDA